MNAPRPTILAALVLGSTLPGLVESARAALSIGYTPTIIDFDSTVAGSNNGAFTGTGFAPSPNAGQLDSDAWIVTGLSDGAVAFGGTQTTGDFARGASDGGVATGGVYAFDVGDGNTALGVQPIEADFTPGSFVLMLENATGSTLTSLLISWDVFILNDQPRANSLGLQYSTEFPTDESNWIKPAAFTTTSTEAADALGWTKVPFENQTISGLSIAHGANLFLRWSGDDVSGSGSRDEFAIDNISFSAIPEPAHAIITGFLLLTGLGHRRRGRGTLL